MRCSSFRPIRGGAAAWCLIASGLASLACSSSEPATGSTPPPEYRDPEPAGSTASDVSMNEAGEPDPVGSDPSDAPSSDSEETPIGPIDFEAGEEPEPAGDVPSDDPEPEPPVDDELVAPRAESPIGWASVNAEGQNGTFGGRGGPLVIVTNADQLRAAVDGTDPRIVRVRGSFDAGRVDMGSNKTVEGEPGSVLGINLRFLDDQNVIVRDLTLRGNRCQGLADCSQGDDVVELRNTHHVWFHHVDVADGDDGNLDIVRASDYVTVSWSRFSYASNNREHRFSNLIGNGDDVPEDVGRLRVTWHNNWWAENVDQRMPRTRRGRIHVFNNLYTASGNSYCTNAGFEASLLVENNVYVGVNNPLSPDANGDMLARGNLFLNTSGNQNATGQGFQPGYDYSLQPTAGLEALIRAEAGPRPLP
jgi:pectate lyase